MRSLLLLVVLAGCRPQTPADHTRNIKAVVDVARVECAIYAATPSLPRDAKLTARCSALLEAQ